MDIKDFPELEQTSDLELLRTRKESKNENSSKSNKWDGTYDNKSWKGSCGKKN